MAKSSPRTVSRKSTSAKRETAPAAAAKLKRKSKIEAKPERSVKTFQITDAAKAPAGRVESKQAKVLAMLRTSGGTTIEAIVFATGWQSHSVRGFFAGVVRKKLGHLLTSEKGEGGRIYKVVGDQPPAAVISRSKAKAAA